MEPDPAGQLADRIRELRGPVSQGALAYRLGVDRTTISRAESGSRLPSPDVVSRLDNHFRTGGELAQLRRTVVAEGDDEGDDVDATRRQLLHNAALFATVTAAADVADRMATADPKPGTIRELTADADHLAAGYLSVPLAALVPRAESGWTAAERYLDGRLSARARPKVTVLAGSFAFYLAMLANDAGHRSAADTYLDLAGQYGRESGDLILIGSCAALDSTFAHFRGDHQRAADVAAAARPNAHPYVRGMLAVCEARAAARTGRDDQARRALDDMWAHLWEGPPLPGEVPVDEEVAHAQSAVILGTLGDGGRAETHARHTLSILDSRPGDHPGHRAGTLNALATAYLARPQPEPERAALAGLAALRTIDGSPLSWVVSSTGQLWRRLDTRWGSLDQVAELGAAIVRSRRALMPGTPTVDV
jgi:transcriptional regulator with XRE-family HTH domain